MDLPAAMPAPLPAPLPAASPAVLPAVPPALLPAVPVARPHGRSRLSLPSSGPHVTFAVNPLPGPVAHTASGHPLRSCIRSSSRLSACAAPDVSSDPPARTGQRARLGEVARILATVAAVGSSRVLPPALAAAVRDISRRPLPWVVPVGPADAVPPPGIRLLAESRRAPPRASTLGGRILGGEANRARLLSLLSRDQQPLLEESPALPGMQYRTARISSATRSNPSVRPLAKAVATPNTWINPLTYPLYATQRLSRSDVKRDAYATEVGYDDAKPRLGQGFQYDAKRIAKAGMTWREAQATPHANEYTAADLRERDVLLSTKSLVPIQRLAAKGHQISFRRVCAYKPHKVGSKQFDCRFCLHGFRQREGTYDPARVSTPVCRRDSDRLTMAWAAGRSDCRCNIGDADRAFLQSSMTKHDSPMWIVPPREWGFPTDTVLQVANSVYGLMQACYNWCEKLDSVLIAAGAVPFETDPRSFILVRRDKAGNTLKTFCHAHVDDMKIIGQEVPHLMAKIEEKIKMTWKGFRPEHFCGVQYAYGDNHEIFVYMKDTADSLLALCKSSGIDVDNLSKPLTPMVAGAVKDLMSNFATDGLIPANDLWYRSMHGLTQWMENSARLDVSFAVRVLAAAVGKNTPAHDEAMMRLVAWIHAHATDGIVYGGDKAALGKGFVAFPDASFADGFKALSTQGSIIKFHGSVVAWSSKQQSCTAQDTMESEYITASTTGRSLLGWLNMLNDLGLEQGAVPCYEDNSAAHSLITSDYVVRGARHINVRYHMVQELHRLGIIDMRHCSTSEQQADLMTKALDQVKLQANLLSLGFMSLAQFRATYGGS